MTGERTYLGLCSFNLVMGFLHLALGILLHFQAFYWPRGFSYFQNRVHARPSTSTQQRACGAYANRWA